MSKHKGRHDVPTTFESGIAIREIRPGYWLVDFMVDGTRTRKAYSDLEEAKTYCREKRLELRNKGTEALALPDRTRAEALKAMEILRGTGA